LLRQAVPADAAAVTAVYLASRRHFLPYAPSAHPDDDVLRYLGSLISEDRVTVAVEHDEIVGLLAVSVENGIGWIDQLYLRPDRIHRGIGRQLLAEAIRLLPPRIRLYTFQANHAARAFYERHGFAVLALSDGATNEEKCPDALYERIAAAGIIP
jgi:ribosomal protein S18 acetylase RimI-like enzyme